MRYEQFHGVPVPKVGFGTWSIGGGETADPRKDAKSLAALRSALEMGYTHFDTAESYAAGHCEELLAGAMRELHVDRASVLITSKVKAGNLAAANVIKACEGSLKRLNTEYIDLYLVHWPNRSIPLQDTFEGLNRLAQMRKIRHVGVSNFDLDLLRQAQALSESALMTNQVPMSIVDRSYVANGVLGYCQANGILLTAYSPVKSRQLDTDAQVGRVAAGRGLTPSQVGIAWLCSQPGIITIPMSSNPQHQRQNLEAADIVLTAEEMQLLG